MGVPERRLARQREIVDATRALFDERGVRDAQIEDIARAVGVNRAIIYRHFTGKEELFAVTVIGYLEELDAALTAAHDETASPVARLEALVTAFLDYGLAHPAFVDCAQSLLRRRGTELLDEVSQEVMFNLGRAMGACMAHAVRALRDGTTAGEFDVPDPSLLANILYAQGLGLLNLAHLQISVREKIPGFPVIEPVSTDTLRAYVLQAVIAMARGGHGVTTG